MKDSYIIPKALGKKVLMIGVHYKDNAPGGMAAVIQYYEQYFEVIRYTSTWKLSNPAVKLFLWVSAYTKVLLNLSFDRDVKLLHIHTAADASFWRKSMFVKLGKRFHKKVILHVHASRFKDFYNESDKKVKIVDNLNVSDCLIVLSESWKNWFIEIGVTKNKIEVLHNITAYPQIVDTKENSTKVRFLFLGELGQRKGVFDILRGLSNHREALKDKIELRIGGNTNEEKLLITIKEAGLENFVKFEGWVAGEKKKRLLNWADVYILPSFNEGLPIGILEAMSYGCPIISTPVGGIAEVVHTGENGVLLTPGDDEQIITAIKKYVLDPELLKSEGDLSKKEVETYLPDHVLGHLKSIYQDCLG